MILKNKNIKKLIKKRKKVFIKNLLTNQKVKMINFHKAWENIKQWAQIIQKIIVTLKEVEILKLVKSFNKTHLNFNTYS